MRAAAARFDTRPRVYFEEWDEPMISGIRWVSELIGIAGGEDCFADNAQQSLGKDRIIADPLEVVRRAPDIILGSWCGKKFRPDVVASRRVGSAVPAVAQRAAARDQVIDHPAAGPGRAHRWRDARFTRSSRRGRSGQVDLGRSQRRADREIKRRAFVRLALPPRCARRAAR